MVLNQKRMLWILGSIIGIFLWTLQIEGLPRVSVFLLACALGISLYAGIYFFWRIEAPPWATLFMIMWSSAVLILSQELLNNKIGSWATAQLFFTALFVGFGCLSVYPPPAKEET